MAQVPLLNRVDRLGIAHDRLASVVDPRRIESAAGLLSSSGLDQEDQERLGFFLPNTDPLSFIEDWCYAAD
jgi:hypothetical protein